MEPCLQFWRIFSWAWVFSVLGSLRDHQRCSNLLIKNAEEEGFLCPITVEVYLLAAWLQLSLQEVLYFALLLVLSLKLDPFWRMVRQISCRARSCTNECWLKSRRRAHSWKWNLGDLRFSCPWLHSRHTLKRNAEPQAKVARRTRTKACLKEFGTSWALHLFQQSYHSSVRFQ